jgi:hypothetical protein
MEKVSWEFPDFGIHMAKNNGSRHTQETKTVFGTNWMLELYRRDNDNDNDDDTKSLPAADEQQQQQNHKKLRFNFVVTRKRLSYREPVCLRVRYAFFVHHNSDVGASSSSLLWSDDRLGREFEVGTQFDVDNLALFDDFDSMNKSLAADDGTLVITVHFKLLSSSSTDDKAAAASCWKPAKIVPHPTLSRLRTDRTWADIAFSVVDDNADGGGRRKFLYAHRNILALHAPALLRLATAATTTNESSNSNNDRVIKEEEKDEENACSGSSSTTTIIVELPVWVVDPLALENLLAYIYDGSLPHRCDTYDSARAMLFAADRFACTSLKLYVESYMAEEILNHSNAADFLLLADALSCPFLKEAVFDEIAFVPSVVFDTEGWTTRVLKCERLVMEVMTARYCEPTEDERQRHVECLSVNTLRYRLVKQGLDVDGSRETLVKRLKTAHHRDHDAPASDAASATNSTGTSSYSSS